MMIIDYIAYNILYCQPYFSAATAPLLLYWLRYAILLASTHEDAATIDNKY